MRRRRSPGRPITTERAAPDLGGWQNGEPEAEETGPLRRCIITRERQGKERMIRFVIGPERALVLDLSARLPGRGIWLSARRDVLENAHAHGTFAKGFARAARGPVVVPADLISVLQAALVRRIGELLGLSRRAGQAVAGFEKAREWLRSGQAGLVVQAADGSREERARFLSGVAPEIPVLAPLPATSLGRVFGRDRVVHVAVTPGRLAGRLVVEAGRLAGLAAPVPAEAGLDGLHTPAGDATGSETMNKRACE